MGASEKTFTGNLVIRSAGDPQALLGDRPSRPLTVKPLAARPLVEQPSPVTSTKAIIVKSSMSASSKYMGALQKLRLTSPVAPKCVKHLTHFGGYRASTGGLFRN